MQKQQKKSIKVKKEDLGSLFGHGQYVPTISLKKKSNNFNKNHNWNTRLEQWEQGEKQLIFACENKEKKMKIIKIIKKIKKL